MVRGYLLYQEVREVSVGEILSHIREVGNHIRLLFLPLGFMEIFKRDKRYSTKNRNSLTKSASMRLLTKHVKCFMGMENTGR